MIKIVSNADIDQFIELPFKLYKGNSFYIPELKTDTKHTLTADPFWMHSERELFLALEDGKPIGRISAIINRTHNDYWRDKVGFFGFFECTDSQEAATALINAAGVWLKERGMTSIRGPLNPSSNHTCGILLDSFDKEPLIMMPYNPGFYNTLMEGAGLEKAKDLLAFERTDRDDFSPRMKKIMERILKNKSIRCRKINLSRFKEEVEMVRNIYNASWAQNWGFVPITKEEIQNTAKQLKLIVKTELTCVIEYDGKPAGFAITVPNMNRVLKALNGTLTPLKILSALLKWHAIKDCRMIMLGVHPDYRGRGLELLLVRSVVYDGIKKGWNKAELSWLLEDNQAIISIVEESGCHKSKTYRIYEKPI